MYFPNADVAVNPFLLVLLGAIVGTVGGFFGVGGGFLVTAGLLVFGVPTIFAVGTGVSLILGSASINALKHRDLGNVDYRLAALITIGTVPALFLAKNLNTKLDSIGAIGPVVGYIYVVLLTLLGIFIIYDYWKTQHSASTSDEEVSTAGLARRIHSLNLRPGSIGFPGLGHISLYAALPTSHIDRVYILIPVATGLVVGFLAGLLGAGGGFMIMPAMIFIMGIPTRVAVGTSLVLIIVTGALGTVLYAFSNNVDLLMAMLMLAAASAGSQLGATATRFVDASRIRFLFGLIVLSGGVAVALEQVGQISPRLTYLDTLASVTLLGVSGAIAILIGVLLMRAKLGGRASSEDGA